MQSYNLAKSCLGATDRYRGFNEKEGPVWASRVEPSERQYHIDSSTIANFDCHPAIEPWARGVGSLELVSLIGIPYVPKPVIMIPNGHYLFIENDAKILTHRAYIVIIQH